MASKINTQYRSHIEVVIQIIIILRQKKRNRNKVINGDIEYEEGKEIYEGIVEESFAPDKVGGDKIKLYPSGTMAGFIEGLIHKG